MEKQLEHRFNKKTHLDVFLEISDDGFVALSGRLWRLNAASVEKRQHQKHKINNISGNTNDAKVLENSEKNEA